ncbi:hypothetical protein DMB65_12615 [Flavobacterium cheongpyeongense]|uniref:Uncharacterized protein n=1 Tax=Flavobacterium cheongpyeongense TaxID=2212651 RepID=A0A2V4C2K1_9FLAO|nr:hypothetical protein DMB65_12615 [Flavobacterium cheongpyeongense]
MVTENAYKSQVFHYQKKQECLLRGLCHQAKGNRTIEINIEEPSKGLHKGSEWNYKSRNLLFKYSQGIFFQKSTGSKSIPEICCIKKAALLGQPLSCSMK